ncbi:MAG: chromate efflux transporter [Chloroflexales bacterium]|nr:chromate efflux transporter [Chloroflexales bacterium]
MQAEEKRSCGERGDALEQPISVSAADPSGSPLEVLVVFTRLGLTSFGGPVAHLGYYREEIVKRRRWVDEATYADMVALCQFLPGPASSQTGISLGTARAGVLGGLAAWCGFTLPSALAMMAFALGLSLMGNVTASGWLHGLKVVAVAVVAQAVWGMARSLCPDRPRATIAILTTILLLAWPSSLAQIAALVAGGLAGGLLLAVAAKGDTPALPIRVPRALSLASAALLALGLLGLPALAAATGNHAVALFDAFFRAGSLVFGGGHVVLPLLQEYTVTPGWVTADQFIAGYGAAQAVPGPLLTFSAYLGAIGGPEPNGVAGAAIALVGIFLPSFLLLWAALPVWGRLRAAPWAQAALAGVNAAVVGLLLAALYDPVITSAIRGPIDVALALGAFGALQIWKAPPWAVVLLMAVVAGVIGVVAP